MGSDFGAFGASSFWAPPTNGQKETFSHVPCIQTPSPGALPESDFGALNILFPIKTTINLLTRGKNLFGIDNDFIKIGNTADLTLFNPLSEYLFDEDNILSKSKNSIFIGSKLKGKVYGVINKGQVELNS